MESPWTVLNSPAWVDQSNAMAPGWSGLGSIQDTPAPDYGGNWFPLSDGLRTGYENKKKTNTYNWFIRWSIPLNNRAIGDGSQTMDNVGLDELIFANCENGLFAASRGAQSAGGMLWSATPLTLSRLNQIMRDYRETFKYIDCGSEMLESWRLLGVQSVAVPRYEAFPKYSEHMLSSSIRGRTKIVNVWGIAGEVIKQENRAYLLLIKRRIDDPLPELGANYMELARREPKKSAEEIVTEAEDAEERSHWYWTFVPFISYDAQPPSLALIRGPNNAWFGERIPIGRVTDCHGVAFNRPTYDSRTAAREILCPTDPTPGKYRELNNAVGWIQVEFNVC